MVISIPKEKMTTTEHESRKRCKCKKENKTITIQDPGLRDPLKYIIIKKYLSTGERFPLLFVSKYFNQQLIFQKDKQKIKKYFITKSTTKNLINWYRSIYLNSHKNVINTVSIISYGNLQLLDDLKEKKYKELLLYIVNDKYTYCFDDAFYIAALKGNLDNMKWLKESGYPWSTLTFDAATLNGKLDNMKWLLENGCPWNFETLEAAEQNGNPDNLKWLKENGCPIVYEYEDDDDDSEFLGDLIVSYNASFNKDRDYLIISPSDIEFS